MAQHQQSPRKPRRLEAFGQLGEPAVEGTRRQLGNARGRDVTRKRIFPGHCQDRWMSRRPCSDAWSRACFRSVASELEIFVAERGVAHRIESSRSEDVPTSLTNDP